MGGIIRANEKEKRSEADPLIDEVRAIRANLADRFNHDLKAWCDYLKTFEAQHAGRVRAPQKRHLPQK